MSKNKEKDLEKLRHAEYMMLSEDMVEFHTVGFMRILETTNMKWDIAQNMQKYGGQFVQALGRCVMTADSRNLKLLVENFRPYFNQYLPHEWKRILPDETKGLDAVSK